MPRLSRVRVPPICDALVYAAGWLVPKAARAGWRAREDAALRSLRTLIARGELAADASVHLAAFCREALASAVWLRFQRDEVQRWMRGPAFLMACGVTALAMMGVLSRGFAVTRSIVAAARVSAGDMVMAYTVPIVFALITSLALISIRRLALHRAGWRYWGFFLSKTLLAMILPSVAWIEGGAAVRAMIPRGVLHVWFGGLMLTMLFIGLFGWCVLWSLEDQRWRCPVCLELLALPVRFGSWASVFDPATTEVFCRAGHGMLSVTEADLFHDTRWAELDASWGGLFGREGEVPQKLSR